MTTFLHSLPPDFLPDFLAGMLVNFRIAGIALVLGLAFGFVLAWARLGGRIAAGAAMPVVGLMRAAPTFVVMFFLLNAIPPDAALFGISVAPSGIMTVALSLVPYAAAYVADNGVEALQQLRRGSSHAALLFLPNVTRVFLVLVMSSSTGAAIGVPEGIAVLLRAADHVASLGEKLAIFAFGIFCFGIVLQAGFGLMNLLHRRLGIRAASRRAA